MVKNWKAKPIREDGTESHGSSCIITFRRKPSRQEGHEMLFLAVFLFLGDKQSFMRQASLIRSKKIIFFLNAWSINWRVTNFNLNCFAACCVVEADQRPGWLYLYCFLSSHNHVSSWWHKTSRRICFCCREAQKATWTFYCGRSSHYWLQSQTDTCFHHWFVEKIYCELA